MADEPVDQGRAIHADDWQLKSELKDVARGLRALHRDLVDVARQEFEAENGPIGSAGNMLQLLLHEDSFAWLRALSELMVDVDELIDVKGLTASDGAMVRGEIERLLSPNEGEESTFSARYLAAIQREPFLAVSHAQVRKDIAKLAVPSSEDRAAAGAARTTWSARRLESRAQRKLEK